MPDLARKLLLLTWLFSGASSHESYRACASQSDSASLIQTRQWEDDKSLKACLSFIHIPKTMGGTIEGALIEANRIHSTSEHPSCAVAARRGKIQHRLWGVCDDRIRCSNASGWPWQAGQRKWPSCRVPASPPASTPESIRELVHKGVAGCSPWHFPPAFDAIVAASYMADCDSFCVVRDPMLRMLSQLRTMHQLSEVCDPDMLEKFTRKALLLLDLKNDCHFVPQVYYVFQDGDPTAPRICRHILKYDDIDSGFPMLMEKYGLGQTALRKHVHKSNHCNVTPTAATVQMVKEFYSRDYEAFGFSAEPVMVSL
ncbi:unnamed protein product [Symbiodinium microadriaticum]|nr:unnamed protein product [Symbiodinium microadriaticum]